MGGVGWERDGRYLVIFNMCTGWDEREGERGACLIWCQLCRKVQPEGSLVGGNGREGFDTD